MYQQGNVLPYVLAMMAALLFSAQYVFNAYKVSNQSTQLQNTTDAAAYSVATVYAQNYNFVALSNRALVANQITMAQVVTTVSWMRMLVTLAETVNDIGQYIPYVAAITNIIDNAAQAISPVLETAAPIISEVVAKYILAGSQAQKIAVPLTAVIAQEVLAEVVEKNDPDVDYSLATVSISGQSATHLSSLYGQSDCYNEAEKVRSGSFGDEETIARCRQFRNITLASRDGFTESRTYRFQFPAMPATIILPDVAVEPVAGQPLYSTLTLERGGETVMGGDTPAVEKDTPFTTWTAIDTTSLHASTHFINLQLKADSTTHAEKVKLGVGHAYAGDECSSCHHITHEGSDAWSKNPRGSSCTDPDSYNGYADGSKSQNDSAFALMDVAALDCGSLANNYREPLSDNKGVGLSLFYNLKDEGYVEKKDHIMVYLRKSQHAVKTASQTTGGGTGAYKLDRYQGAQNSVFHGSAGAAVFFRRGNDQWMLNSGRRLDGRLEFGNSYNPFWEARLDRLTTDERIALEAIKEL